MTFWLAAPFAVIVQLKNYKGLKQIVMIKFKNQALYMWNSEGVKQREQYNIVIWFAVKNGAASQWGCIYIRLNTPKYYWNTTFFIKILILRWKLYIITFNIKWQKVGLELIKCQKKGLQIRVYVKFINQWQISEKVKL